MDRIDRRIGPWLEVEQISDSAKQGFVFSGFLTKLIPPESTDVNCYNLMELKNWLLLNLSPAKEVGKGENLSEGYDWAGKDRDFIKWTSYSDGTTTYTRFGYESQFFCIDTHRFNFNDLLNYLEDYIARHKAFCQDDREIAIKTNHEKYEGYYFDELNLERFGLTVKRFNLRYHIEIGIEDF